MSKIIVAALGGMLSLFSAHDIRPVPPQQPAMLYASTKQINALRISAPMAVRNSGDFR